MADIKIDTKLLSLLNLLLPGNKGISGENVMAHTVFGRDLPVYKKRPLSIEAQKDVIIQFGLDFESLKKLAIFESSPKQVIDRYSFGLRNIVNFLEKNEILTWIALENKVKRKKNIDDYKISYDIIKGKLGDIFTKYSVDENLQTEIRGLLSGYTIPPVVLILAKSIFEVEDDQSLRLASSKAVPIPGVQGVFATVGYPAGSHITIYNGIIVLDKNVTERTSRIDFDIDDYDYKGGALDEYLKLRANTELYNHYKSITFEFDVDSGRQDHKTISGEMNHSWATDVMNS